MSPGDERFVATTTVLIENVMHHVNEEEQDWFLKAREGLGRRTLQGDRRGADRSPDKGREEAVSRVR